MTDPSSRSVTYANIRTIGDKEYAKKWNMIFGKRKKGKKNGDTENKKNLKRATP